MNLKSLLSPIVTLMLGACATAPVPQDIAKFAPHERVFLKTVAGPGMATAIFIRDSGASGSAVSQSLAINNKIAAELNTSEKAVFHLKPGDYIFSAPPFDPFGSKATMAIDQELKPDRTYSYRILMDGNSGLIFIQRLLPAAK